MSLVCLQRLISILFSHGGIRPGPRIRKLHRLPEQVEVLQNLDRFGRLVRGLEDHKGLPFGFHILLGDDVEDSARVAEGVAEFFDEARDFDFLVEVADLDQLL